MNIQPQPITLTLDIERGGVFLPIKSLTVEQLKHLLTVMANDAEIWKKRFNESTKEIK